MAFLGEMLGELPEAISGLDVLEVGSYNVNGSARELFAQRPPRSYLGTDLREGPGVDLAHPAEHLPDVLPADKYDLVICTEVLEHARDWRAVIAALKRLCKPGGLILLTTRGPGFPLHEYPGDYWRFTTAHMREIFADCGPPTNAHQGPYIVPDPHFPGVFVAARKPRALSAIDVDRAPEAPESTGAPLPQSGANQALIREEQLLQPMTLCIPTLCNYDGVDALIRSAEAGSEKPDHYVVLDNGRRYSPGRLEAIFGEHSGRWTLITPEENLGVAASWNTFLGRFGKAAPIVISNDDIVLGPTAFALLHEYAIQGAPRAGFGWALFMQHPECTEKVGYYDENFWPAYHEDIDYIIRMRRAGITDVRLEGKIDISHGGWMTTRQLGNPVWLAEGRERNLSYLVAKWGTQDLTSDTYLQPFNGKPPAGWDLRKRGPALPFRWDIINEIAEMIGAKRYLELGLADGSCIRRIKVGDRTGVDMAAPPDVGDAVAFQCTTDEFFRTTDQKWDLVFVDADHAHDQAYRDVDNAIRHLNPGGVVVMHDCSPFNEAMQIVPHNGYYLWTGDVWRAVVRLRWEGQHAVRVVNSDYGIGIVIPGGTPHHFVSRPRKPESLTYADLIADRENLLGLVSGWEWKEWFERAYEPLVRQPFSREGVGEYGANMMGVGEYWDGVAERMRMPQDSPGVGLYDPQGFARIEQPSEPKRDTLVVIFSKLPRADTTGTHLLAALERLVRVEHHEPLFRDLVGNHGPRLAHSTIEWPRARAVLCIDDDHGWPLPDPAMWTGTTLPRYYWCIDTYRMDAELYLGGTRRERQKQFDKVFYVQQKEARLFGGEWLPVGVDLAQYRFEPKDIVYDFCFIGNVNNARTDFLRRLTEVFPRSFVGQAYGEAANTIYNQSKLAINYSAGGDINMRMFEGQATSALLLSNTIDNGENGLLPYLPLFDSFEECVRAMVLFLKNPGVRVALSARQAEDMAAHTYEVRARAFLKSIAWPGF